MVGIPLNEQNAWFAFEKKSADMYIRQMVHWHLIPIY